MSRYAEFEPLPRPMLCSALIKHAGGHYSRCEAPAVIIQTTFYPPNTWRSDAVCETCKEAGQ